MQRSMGVCGEMFARKMEVLLQNLPTATSSEYDNRQSNHQDVYDPQPRSFFGGVEKTLEESRLEKVKAAHQVP